MKKICLLLLAVLLPLMACNRPASPPASFRDLDGQAVGVLLSLTQQQQLERHINDARYLPFEDLMSMCLALEKDQIRGFVCRRPGSEHLLQENPGFHILPGPVLLDTAAVAFRQQDKELQASFNAFLRQIRADGTLEAMQNNWFAPEGGKTPYHHRHGPGTALRVGIEVGQSFFTYVSENEEVGFEPELILRFGEYLGRPIQFVEMTGSGMVPSLRSGRVDALVSNINPSRARQKDLCFSDPYDVSELCIIVRQEAERQGFFTRLGNSLRDNILKERRYMMILEGLWTTLLITLSSVLLGSLLGILLCLFRLSPRRWKRRFAEQYCSIVEGIPILVLLLIMFYVVFAFTPLAGWIVAIITFSLHFAAGACECFYTGVENVTPDQREAGLALGFTKARMLRYIVVPQAMKTILPLLKGRCITLLENTSIVGFIAIKDLTKMVDIVRSQTYDAVIPLGILALVYFLLTRLLGLLLDKLGDLYLARYE